MILDLIYLLVIIAVTLQFPGMLLNQKEQQFLDIAKKLVLFHFLLGVAYYFQTRNGGGDAWGYWRAGKSMTGDTFWVAIREGEGTLFTQALNYFPAGVLNMGFFANTMFFSMLGALGMVLFFVVAIRTVPYNKIISGYVLFPVIFFLPNLHFWSAGVGKDTILFLCIAMFAYGVMKPLVRMPLLIISILLALSIRPHIVLFLVVGFGLAYIMGGKVSAFQRFAFSAVLIGIGIAILPSVMEFAKIEEASVESFDSFAAKKADVLSRSHTGSAIDISSYPFPLKVLTFWFRPFFFDARNINGLVASIENLLLVIVFIKAMRTQPLKAFRAAPFVIKGLVFFLIVGTLAFSQSLGNVGIMIRMRNMFLPGLLIYLMWVFSYEQQRIREFQLYQKQLSALKKKKEE
ncbi:hypothetical protein MTP09_02505 [Chryseobacterium suipulveris]|uniref:EpsG family protein n=1 Tax=Chryseobacterium suipulveris TaxID=2929800 RepID=A0ABY4BV05_9FLAO|nr:hypothetical protein [Chryseobacterium suipulveris]UOE41533.1 hypothetical protein MTP09_02505 [Chryseobacterium suipulveris]